MTNRTLTSFTPAAPWFGRLARGDLLTAAPARGGLRVALPGFRTPRRGSSGGAGLVVLLRAAWRRHRSRLCLAELDAYLLKDIGVSYAEAEAEANKPFWLG
jgi:uncharacterized protein YjiS (DUF1127 family)